jgi:tetratricopeptide (TPR) repeat protein
MTDHALAAFAVPPEKADNQSAASLENIEPEPPVAIVEPEPVTVVEQSPPPAQLEEITSTKVGVLHREALNAYRAQQLDKAIDLWDQALVLDPEFESARLYRSQAIELRQKLKTLN